MDWSGIVGTVFDELTTLLNNLLVFVAAGLPNSPFTYLEQSSVISKYLGSINYFIPISYMVSVLQAWCLAIGIFYVWQLALRWAKAIE